MCTFIFYGVTALIVGFIKLFSGEGLSLFLFSSGILSLVAVFFMGKKSINKVNDFRDWTESTYQKYGLNKDNINIKFDELYQNVIIYTNDKKLYFGSYHNKSFELIDISEILQVNVLINYVLDDRRRRVASSRIVQITLETKTIETHVDLQNDTLDRANRLKLLLEKQIKELNT